MPANPAAVSWSPTLGATCRGKKGAGSSDEPNVGCANCIRQEIVRLLDTTSSHFWLVLLGGPLPGVVS